MKKKNMSTETPQLLLDNQICFSLYACSREIIKKYKPLLDPLGITYTQYVTLLVLWETPQLNFKVLAERLKLDSGTLTPLLKKMEQAGLLKRSRDPMDERSVIITLSEEGMALKSRAKEIPLTLAKQINLDKEMAINLKRDLDAFLKAMESAESY